MTEAASGRTFYITSLNQHLTSREEAMTVNVQNKEHVKEILAHIN